MKMIEKVALSIRTCCDPVNYATSIVMAKAAIVALREPTEEMIKVAYEDTSDGMDCRELYRQMIDAALKE